MNSQSPPNPDIAHHAPSDLSRRRVLGWMAAAGVSPLLAACGSGNGVDINVAVTNPPETGWALDFRGLSSTLTAGHPDPTGVLRSAHWTEAVNRAATGAAARSFNANVVEAGKLFGLLGDAHTTLTSGLDRFTTIPARFSWINSAVYLTSATAALSAHLGARLTAIDGMPVAAVMDRVALARPFYNVAGKQAGAPRFMSLPEFLMLIGVATTAGSATYSLELPNGTQQSLRLTAEPLPQTLVPLVSGANVPLWQSVSGVNYWTRVIENNTVAYFRYIVCADDPGRPIAGVMDELAAALNKMATPRLIIDVRANQGGDSSVLSNAMQAASNKMTASPQIAVLLDRNTFSSGFRAVYDIRRGQASARTFGQPSSQAPTSPSEVVTRQLTSSGLSYQMSTRMFTVPLGSDPNIYTPDSLIEPTIEDVKAGRDPVLEQAIAWLQSQ
ncbi:MAG: hypothetical protein JNM76_15245 [Betaproteobacteria bacterium]|nr:hypothetical protein [Betaproteobacteria bacterium]